MTQKESRPKTLRELMLEDPRVEAEEAALASKVNEPKPMRTLADLSEDQRASQDSQPEEK